MYRCDWAFERENEGAGRGVSRGSVESGREKLQNVGQCTVIWPVVSASWKRPSFTSLLSQSLGDRHPVLGSRNGSQDLEKCTPELEETHIQLKRTEERFTVVSTFG